MIMAKWALVALMTAAGEIPPATPPDEGLSGPTPAGIITYDDGRFVVDRVEDAVLSYCYRREVFEEIIALDAKDRAASAKLFQEAPDCHTAIVRAVPKRVLKTVLTSGGKHYFTEMEMVGGWLGSRFFPNGPETIFALTPYPTAANTWRGKPGTEQRS